MHVRILVVAFCLLILSCSTPDSNTNNRAVYIEPEPVVETSMASYNAGKDLFMTHCFFCHGKDATGNGPLGEAMEAAKPRDFTLPIMATVHPDSLKRVILEGGEAIGLSPNMPAWKSTVSEKEAELLVVFIHTVSQNGGLLPESSDSYKLTDIPGNTEPSY